MGIEARNVTKRYGEFTALDDLTLTVDHGTLTLATTAGLSFSASSIVATLKM